MEMPSCSGTSHIAALKNAEQVQAADLKGDSSQSNFENVPVPESSLNADNYEFDLYYRNMTFDAEEENSNQRDHYSGLGLVVNVDTNKASLANDNQVGLSQSGIKTLEQDEPLAVWVKWRGLWQAGIRCASQL